MPIHKMEDPQVNLSQDEEAVEDGVLDLRSDNVDEIEKVETEPLDLRTDVVEDEHGYEEVISEGSLTQEKLEHRKSFEERVMRIAKEWKKKKKAEENSLAKETPFGHESVGDYIAKEEGQIKKQLGELSERLKKLEQLRSPLKEKLSNIQKETVINNEELKPNVEQDRETTPEQTENNTDCKLGETVRQANIKKIIDRPLIPKKTYEFPPGFLWGTSTSAYQVEGGITNNWSVWERSPRLRRELRKRGKNPDDFICGQACDSYNRYEEDFDLAVSMSNNAIRLGLEWARIQPKKDTWDIEAIDHYRKVLTAAKKRHLKTIVTLWHWTIPVWVSRDNGWENKETIEHFLRYVGLVIKELGADIDYWLTLNEPMALVGFGYLRGNHPPGKKLNLFPAGRVQKNLVSAHNEAYDKIHNHFSNAKVSLSMITDYFEPFIRWDPLHIVFSALAKYLHHGRFYNKIKDRLDFIGLNYYFHNRISYIPPFKFNQNERINEMGWELYPRGIYHVLKYLDKFKKPIIITENGVADHDDDQRSAFINNHLRYIHKAIEEGVNVRGYMHWSLIDNFEWAWGWTQKFGLHEVNRETFERKARPSARVYADICKNNRIEI